MTPTLKNKLSFLTLNKKQSLFLPAILSYLDVNLPDNSSTIVELSYAVFLLSLIAFLCFINVLFFSVSYILVQKGNYELKYPKLKFFINYYKKTTLIYLFIEAILCSICLIILITFSFLYFYTGVKG